MIGPIRLFIRLPGFTRTPPGWEWAVWRRLPAVLLWGTLLPAGYGLWQWMGVPAGALAADERAALLMVYRVVGVVVLHWTLVLTVALGCFIVRVMKGPAYVADPYPPLDRCAVDGVAAGHCPDDKSSQTSVPPE